MCGARQPLARASPVPLGELLGRVHRRAGGGAGLTAPRQLLHAWDVARVLRPVSGKEEEEGGEGVETGDHVNARNLAVDGGVVPVAQRIDGVGAVGGVQVVPRRDDGGVAKVACETGIASHRASAVQTGMRRCATPRTAATATMWTASGGVSARLLASGDVHECKGGPRAGWGR
jgi:hypothetical protein